MFSARTELRKSATPVADAVCQARGLFLPDREIQDSVEKFPKARKVSFPWVEARWFYVFTARRFIRRLFYSPARACNSFTRCSKSQPVFRDEHNSLNLPFTQALTHAHERRHARTRRRVLIISLHRCIEKRKFPHAKALCPNISDFKPSFSFPPCKLRCFFITHSSRWFRAKLSVKFAASGYNHEKAK